MAFEKNIGFDYTAFRGRGAWHRSPGEGLKKDTTFVEFVFDLSLLRWKGRNTCMDGWMGGWMDGWMRREEKR